MDGRRLGSVVIPAHNEGSRIAACLYHLLSGSTRREFTVVVVCNGCTDDTAGIARRAARSLDRDVLVLERAAAGKAAALQAVEPLGLGFPRLYLDADVLCPTTTARVLLGAVQSSWDLAVPGRVLDLDAASYLARLYYRTWSSLPWVRKQLTGRGAYAVSEAFRRVMADLPEIVAEDRFVTTRLPRETAVIVPDAVTIRPPGRLADIVRVRSRVYSGNALVDAPTHDRGAANRAAVLLCLALQPSAWPGLAVFTCVSLLAKARAAWTLRRGEPVWERDSRRAVAA